jgi:hypothetical protein
LLTDRPSAASASSAMPDSSTGNGPSRSTTKPATACPVPETTKNTVISRPSSA